VELLLPGKLSQCVIKIIKNMFKKISLLFILILVFSVVSFPLIQVKGNGVEESGGISNPLGSGSTFTTLFQGIIDWAIDIGILIAVVMIIWSGFLFMSSGGSEEDITKAKKNLTWTVIGLIVLLIGGGWIDIIKDLLGVGAPTGAANSFYDKIFNIVKYFFGLALALGIGYMIWGGISWMTADGDDDKLTTAKKNLLYGLIGVAIIIGVYTLITIVANFFGVTVVLPS